MSFPRIWVIPGNRPGDDAQVFALAEELGLPFETRKLIYNRSFWPGAGLSGVSADSVRRDIREKTLIPPWPDLIIFVGRRSVPVARWIREQSGGRTRLVFIGHPRIDPETFDLVFTTRQYRTPTGPSMRLQPVAMSRYRERLKATEEERAWLDALPRPHLLLMLGGDTRHWSMRPRSIAEKAAELAHRAGRAGGSLIVARSARTDEGLLDAIEERLERAGCEWRVVRSDFPRFQRLLEDGDLLFPTADSVSMISESAIMHRPVGIVPIEMSWMGRLVLGREVNDNSPQRDLRRFWHHVLGEKLAGTMEQPLASNVANPVVGAAAEVRSLLESSFGKLAV
jgi:mitochondrial fission protein ELM1